MTRNSLGFGLVLLLSSLSTLALADIERDVLNLVAAQSQPFAGFSASFWEQALRHAAKQVHLSNSVKGKIRAAPQAALGAQSHLKLQAASRWTLSPDDTTMPKMGATPPPAFLDIDLAPTSVIVTSPDNVQRCAGISSQSAAQCVATQGHSYMCGAPSGTPAFPCNCAGGPVGVCGIYATDGVSICLGVVTMGQSGVQWAGFYQQNPSAKCVAPAPGPQPGTARWTLSPDDTTMPARGSVPPPAYLDINLSPNALLVTSPDNVQRCAGVGSQTQSQCAATQNHAYMCSAPPPGTLPTFPCNCTGGPVTACGIYATDGVSVCLGVVTLGQSGVQWAGFYQQNPSAKCVAPTPGPTPSPTPSPGPQPTPSPTPKPTPRPSPTPSPTPAPAPGCVALKTSPLLVYDTPVLRVTRLTATINASDPSLLLQGYEARAETSTSVIFNADVQCVDVHGSCISHAVRITTATARFKYNTTMTLDMMAAWVNSISGPDFVYGGQVFNLTQRYANSDGFRDALGNCLDKVKVGFQANPCSQLQTVQTALETCLNARYDGYVFNPVNMQPGPNVPPIPTMPPMLTAGGIGVGVPLRLAARGARFNVELDELTLRSLVPLKITVNSAADPPMASVVVLLRDSSVNLPDHITGVEPLTVQSAVDASQVPDSPSGGGGGGGLGAGAVVGIVFALLIVAAGVTFGVWYWRKQQRARHGASYVSMEAETAVPDSQYLRI